MTQHECKHVETNRGKAKKIAPKLFLSHRITWLDKKVLLKCAFLKNLPIKRSSLANNLKQSGKTAIESHEFSDGDENYPYLSFAYEYGFSSWELDNAKAKCRIEMINNSALDFFADENCHFDSFEKHPTCCLLLNQLFTRHNF